ncbi:uncharacterized protein HMPREF1541_07462 [Cyphellophora europaea CBS 101466]|uniref:Cytochrome P450 n=1 Tax=Cyphellophora europaea (strain CBS 101466) TaxID=1220924 RepID=W2RQ34_CYPE1|nr:uncharacterized protein HMPREF1541_07462 [Cyphellophora europaea CBS 101466]ETN37839.1 hypothetical protein HMPREF1541_07462 [Cyphellophora europaea CBS 101466]
MKLMLSTIVGGLLILFTVWLSRFIIQFRKQRAFYKTVPCPPHDYWWGHLKLVGETMRELPQDFHYQQLMAYIGQKYNMPPVFYLDMWPASYPLMMIFDPEVASQLTQTTPQLKHPVNRAFVTPLVGSPSIVAVDGPEWKLIRSIVISGFAPSYIASLTPILAKHVTRFMEKMSNFSETGEVFPTQDQTSLLTFDVISEIVLGTDRDSQRNFDRLAYHFKHASRLCNSPSFSPKWYLLAIPRWWHASRQTKIITAAIHERHANPPDIRGRAAIDLFIKAYSDEKLNPEHKPNLDPTRDAYFMRMAVCNVKSLLLGGHDTTSSTISYTLALLSTHPSALQTMRTEHNSVFGRSQPFSTIAKRLSAQPSLLSDSNLPYTTACIRETLRIFSPASSTRAARPDGPRTVRFRDRDLPITGQQMWIAHIGFGMRADLFPRPNDFLPERHLPDSPLGPVPKDAWRAFEKGPRACLGVELAMNEMKMVLLGMVAEGWLDRLEVAYPRDAPRAPAGFGGVGGERRWFQKIEFSAKPVLGMPMRVVAGKGGEKGKVR